MSGWSSSGFGADFRAELNPAAYGLDPGAVINPVIAQFEQTSAELAKLAASIGSSSLLTGSLSANTLQFGSNGYERTWSVTGSSTGLVVQEVWSLARLSSGAEIPNHFYEAWPKVGGSWLYGNEDIFQRQDSSVIYFSIRATANYYNGVRLPSYFIPGNEGGVRQSGDIPSTYLTPNLPRPVGPPVIVNYVWSQNR